METLSHGLHCRLVWCLFHAECSAQESRLSRSCKCVWGPNRFNPVPVLVHFMYWLNCHLLAWHWQFLHILLCFLPLPTVSCLVWNFSWLHCLPVLQMQPWSNPGPVLLWVREGDCFPHYCFVRTMLRYTISFWTIWCLNIPLTSKNAKSTQVLGISLSINANDSNWTKLNPVKRCHV